MKKGDILTIHTPGGGGYGPPSQSNGDSSSLKRGATDNCGDDEPKNKKKPHVPTRLGGGSLQQYQLNQESA